MGGIHVAYGFEIYLYMKTCMQKEKELNKE